MRGHFFNVPSVSIMLIALILFSLLIMHYLQAHQQTPWLHRASPFRTNFSSPMVTFSQNNIHHFFQMCNCFLCLSYHSYDFSSLYVLQPQPFVGSSNHSNFPFQNNFAPTSAASNFWGGHNLGPTRTYANMASAASQFNNNRRLMGPMPNHTLIARLKHDPAIIATGVLPNSENFR